MSRTMTLSRQRKRGLIWVSSTPSSRIGPSASAHGGLGGVRRVSHEGFQNEGNADQWTKSQSGNPLFTLCIRQVNLLFW